MAEALCSTLMALTSMPLTSTKNLQRTRSPSRAARQRSRWLLLGASAKEARLRRGESIFLLVSCCFGFSLYACRLGWSIVNREDGFSRRRVRKRRSVTHAPAP